MTDNYFVMQTKKFIRLEAYLSEKLKRLIGRLVPLNVECIIVI